MVFKLKWGRTADTGRFRYAQKPRTIQYKLLCLYAMPGTQALPCTPHNFYYALFWRAFDINRTLMICYPSRKFLGPELRTGFDYTRQPMSRNSTLAVEKLASVAPTICWKASQVGNWNLNEQLIGVGRRLLFRKKTSSQSRQFRPLLQPATSVPQEYKL